MSLKYGDTISVDLAHRLEDHRRLSGSLLADDQIIVTPGLTGDDLVHFCLLITDNPVLFVVILMLSVLHTSNLESRITRLKSIVDLFQDQMFVVSMV